MSIYVSLYPSIHPPTHPSVYLSIYPPIYLPLCPSTYPSIYLPLRLLCGCADPFSPWGPLKFHLIQSKLTVKKWDTLKTSGKKGEGWVREEGGAGFLFFIFFSGWMLARAACSEVEECNVLFFKGPSRWRVDRKVPEKPAPNEWGGWRGRLGERITWGDKRHQRNLSLASFPSHTLTLYRLLSILSSRRVSHLPA